MDQDKGRRDRIDRVLVGEPIAAGGHTLQPVARAGGWFGGDQGAQGGGFGGWLRIKPLEVRVSGPGGEETTVTVTDPTRDAVRRMALVAVVVAAVSGLFLLVGLLRHRS
jgi:hypothetical protein